MGWRGQKTITLENKRMNMKYHKMFRRGAGVLAVITAMFVSVAQADTLLGISVNFTSTVSGTAVLAPGVTAGYVPLANWNNSLTKTGVTGFVDSTGAVVSDFNYTIAGSTYYQAAGPGSTISAGDSKLFSTGYIGYGGGNTLVTITVPELFVSNGYDLYVYFGTDGNKFGTGYKGSIELNSSGTPIYLTQTASPTYNSTWQTSSSTVSPGSSANYIKFSGLTGSTATFNVKALPDWNCFGVMGFQIVSTVPEPSTMVLLSVGGIMLLLAIYRKHRRSTGI